MSAPEPRAAPTCFWAPRPCTRPNRCSAPGASVLIADGLVLRLVIRTETETVTTAVESAEDVTAALTLAGLSTLYVAEEHLPQLRSLLRHLDDGREGRAPAAPRCDSRPARAVAARPAASASQRGPLFVELRSTADIDRFRELARLRVPRSQIDVYSLFDPREINIMHRSTAARVTSTETVIPADAARLPANLGAGASDRVAVVVGTSRGRRL